jgi:hypothetical protein
MNELALQAEAFDRAQPHESLDLEATLMDGLNPNESFDADKLAALCQKYRLTFCAEMCFGRTETRRRGQKFKSSKTFQFLFIA